MRRLVAVDLPAGPAFYDALCRYLDRGDAILPLDHRLATPARARLLAALRPAAVLREDGEHALANAVPTEDGDALVVATSGTTGAPKGVVLTADAVAASARATCARLEIDATSDGFLSCLPLAHIGGLSVLTRARQSGARVEIQPGFDPAAVLSAQRRGATIVSLVPTALRRLGAQAGGFRRIVLGGAAPPEELPSNVVSTYGLTETGSGVVYDGRPLDGVEIALGHDGEISLRGPMLLRAYRDGSDPKSPDGWLATGDVGSFTADGRLVVHGRHDDLIISGGENIWPAAVEAVLARHLAVREVAVAGVVDPEWGQRVVAFVVVANDAVVTLEELRGSVRDELGAVAAPKQLVLVDALPRTALGKVRRPLLVRLAHDEQHAGAANSSPTAKGALPMNRLAGETSPYLRQHRDNPVDWYPWGDAAFARARELDRPLLVSIGYSACHWCHVMAHESFEDEATAAQINEHFVAVKVDREERPDVDAVYMDAVQALTGSGGWPLNVFLDPDGRPFFGGTYFPKEAGRGMASFRSVLGAVASAWSDRREMVSAQAQQLTEVVQSHLGAAPESTSVINASAALDGFLRRFSELFDHTDGGLGRAPKFPQPPMLELVLRAGERGDGAAMQMLSTTLAALASGGIYDHLGGGFARYSVDRQWLVPHFEKMLYDQAGLARLFVRAYAVTGDQRWRQVASETLDYVLRDLRDADGGICSAEDADSEGEEGRFYTWTAQQIDEVLGDEQGAAARDWYGVSEVANFEGGRSILHRVQRGDLLRPPEIEAARAALFEARRQRDRPGLDDKVLTEWNAMTVATLAEAALITGEARYRAAALEIAQFLLAALRREDGRWLRSYQGGVAAHLALLGDYAWLTECFVRLAELTGAPRFIARAEEVAAEMDRLFSAPDGGFFLTGADAEALVVRPRDLYDGVVPAAGSAAVAALVRLGAISGERRHLDRAVAAIAASGAAMVEGPITLPHLIGAALTIESGPLEIVIAGDRPDLVTAVARRYLPESVLLWGEPTAGPLWQGRDDDRAYVCRGGVCLAPVTDPAELLQSIERARRANAA